MPTNLAARCSKFVIVYGVLLKVAAAEKPLEEPKNGVPLKRSVSSWPSPNPNIRGIMTFGSAANRRSHSLNPPAITKNALGHRDRAVVRNLYQASAAESRRSA